MPTLPDILEIYIEQISDDMETPEYDRESSIKGTHPPIRSKLRRQNTDTTSPITGKRYLYEENSIESNKSQKRRVASSAGHSSRERENQLRSSQRQKDKTREREKEREREREREIKRERQREHRPITSTLRSRHTSKSTGISHSLADTSTSRSSQDTHSKPINRAKLIPELPFMKRQIDMAPSTHKSAVSRIGEATRAMDAKVERSKVNGRPTIKRAGSFTTGARVPKRKYKINRREREKNSTSMSLYIHSYSHSTHRSLLLYGKCQAKATA
ncbi:hypothetical protein BDF14DRAFT_376651 [Spinellus fusiger]|nr:hypothetical protein BDF14DRAFT_376651 [Spinellus fusiger]